METRTILGIISVILGIIIMACPLAGFAALSIVVSVSTICLGLCALISGCINETNWASIILGILFIIIGACIWYPPVFALFNVYLCYFIGIFLIILAIVNYFTIDNVNKTAVVLAIIFGIIALIIGYLYAQNPLLIAIVLGIWFIIDGVMKIALPESPI